MHGHRAHCIVHVGLSGASATAFSTTRRPRRPGPAQRRRCRTGSARSRWRARDPARAPGSRAPPGGLRACLRHGRGPAGARRSAPRLPRPAPAPPWGVAKRADGMCAARACSRPPIEARRDIESLEQPRHRVVGDALERRRTAMTSEAVQDWTGVSATPRRCRTSVADGRVAVMRTAMTGG